MTDHAALIAEARARAAAVDAMSMPATGDMLRRLADALEEAGKAEAAVRAIVPWLEANQPDVFRRGLWDAIHAARGGRDGAG